MNDPEGRKGCTMEPAGSGWNALRSMAEGIAAASATGRKGPIIISAFGPASIAADLASSIADSSMDEPIYALETRTLPTWAGPDNDVIVFRSSPRDDSIIGFARDRGCGVHIIDSQEDAAESTVRLFKLLDSLGRGEPLRQLLEASDSLGGFAPEGIEEMRSRFAGKAVAVYATSELKASCRYWRMLLPGCTGMPSFYSEIPEFDHNELVGWFDPNTHNADIYPVILGAPSGSELLDFIEDNLVDILRGEGRDTESIIIDGSSTAEKNLRAFTIIDAIAGGALRCR